MSLYQKPLRFLPGTPGQCSGGVLCLVSAVLLLFSCDSPKRLNKDYLLMQYEREHPVKVQIRELVIKPNDLLNIQIYSQGLKQDDAARFNVTGEQGYLVSLDGTIELPVLGQLKAAGLTRSELQETIRRQLDSFVKDPAVLVRFQQLTIHVLGEVNGPGVKTFPTDKITIIDAISAAGDLTASGRRENVTVSREDNSGIRTIHEIDLRSTSLFLSPVYQLQQNDIVYVNANNQKLKSLKERKFNLSNTLQLGLTVISIVTSLYFIIKNN